MKYPTVELPVEEVKIRSMGSEGVGGFFLILIVIIIIIRLSLRLG